jgi:hypothetical protein
VEEAGAVEDERERERGRERSDEISCARARARGGRQPECRDACVCAQCGPGYERDRLTERGGGARVHNHKMVGGFRFHVRFRSICN